jgi:hypothetical protein
MTYLCDRLCWNKAPDRWHWRAWKCWHTIYYLTGGPIYEAGKRVAGKSSTAKGESKGREDLHLVTYDIPARGYVDHGPILFENGQRPTYVNSVAVGKDCSVYALTRVAEDDRARTDLMRVQGVSMKGDTKE